MANERLPRCYHLRRAGDLSSSSPIQRKCHVASASAIRSNSHIWLLVVVNIPAAGDSAHRMEYLVLVQYSSSTRYEIENMGRQGSKRFFAPMAGKKKMIEP